jgi:hypothetical protein
MAAGAEIALLGTVILWLTSLRALHLATPGVLGDRAALGARGTGPEQIYLAAEGGGQKER